MQIKERPVDATNSVITYTRKSKKKDREKKGGLTFRGGDEKVPRKCSPCVSPRVPPAMDKHLVYSKIAMT